MQDSVEYPDAVRISRGDPWLRFGVDPSRSLFWHDPGARLLALSRRRPSAADAGLLLLPTPGAEPARAFHAGRPLLTALSATSVTLPRDLAEIAVPVLALHTEGVGWDWMWTTTSPPPQARDGEVIDLDGSDPDVAAELSALLAAHSPRHSAKPGSAEVPGWVGVRHEHVMVACAAWAESVPGIPLLASVAVHPGARRGGLGAALSAVITRRALARGAPAVTVDLYADNDAARRVYTRLGFRLGHEFMSWRL